MSRNFQFMPAVLKGYRTSKTEDGEEQRLRKPSVSEDVNYWLTFLWTLLGMRIREMSNHCSRRAAWAIELSSANWWHHEGRVWVSERQEGRRGPSVSLQVHVLSLTQYPNAVIHAAAYYYTHCLSSPFFISFSLCAQYTQWFIKWSTVLTARPGAKQHIDLKSLFK